MEPNWDDAPDWATFLAKDPDGDCYWYAVHPRWDGERKMWLLDTAADGYPDVLYEYAGHTDKNFLIETR